MIIAIIGPSGSGKTTLLDGIVKSKVLDGWSWKRKDEDVFFFVRLTKRLLGQNTFKTYVHSKMFEKPNSLYQRIFESFVTFFFPLAIIFEFSWDYFYYELLFPKKILLKDRYIYDYIVTLRHDFRIALPFYEFLFFNFPRPTLAFYMRLSHDEALRRNKHNFEGAVQANNIYFDQILSSYEQIYKKTKLTAIDATFAQNNLGQIVSQYIQNVLKLKRLQTIAICGIDGAGKTTLLSELSSYLDFLHVPYKVIHFYFDASIIKILKKMKLVSIADWIIHVKRRINKPHGQEMQKRSFGWALINFADGLLIFTIYRFLFPRSVLILDRYFYDYLVSFSAFSVPAIWFFAKISPKTGQAIFLQIDPMLAKKRKPELSLEQLKSLNNEYKTLSQTFKLPAMKNISIERKTKQEVLVTLFKIL